MDAEEFREFGKAAVDYIADYIENIRERPVISGVQPKYLFKHIPPEAPKDGEHWKQILEDFDKFIIPGITHWQSPHFHAFFPTASSFPSIVGELISGGLGIVGLHWLASPACTELEVIMMNWLGKLLNLPKEYLNTSDGPGGGIIQGSASESTLLCLLAAKHRTVKKIQSKSLGLTDDEITNKLVAYTTGKPTCRDSGGGHMADTIFHHRIGSTYQSNLSVEKAGILGSMRMRILKTGKDGQLHRDTLLNAFKDDINNNLIPCYMTATLGSTGICVFDNLEIIGPICNELNVWLHVDAAYAGAALILPEYQYLAKGVSYADSFAFNPHKWLLVNFDCSALWVKNSGDLTSAFSVNRIYLKSNDNAEDTELPEYRNWQIPLGRRMRSLKLWFTLRTYGVHGLQNHIRKHINLAALFASLVKQDDRFEIVTPVRMGLVCFRIKGDNKLTQALHERLMSRRNIYVIVATVNNQIIIRFVICSRLSQESDIHYAWNEIVTQTDEILNGCIHGENTANPSHQLNGSH